MKCLKCSEALEGKIVVRSQDTAVTCDKCKYVNIVQSFTAGNWLHNKVDRIEGPAQVDLGDISETKGKNKDGDKTGKDKKADK